MFNIFNYISWLLSKSQFCKEEFKKGKCSNLKKEACVYRYECKLGYRNKE